MLARCEAGAIAEHEGAWEGPGLGCDEFGRGHAQPGLLRDLAHDGGLAGLPRLHVAGDRGVATGLPSGAVDQDDAVGVVGDGHDDGRIRAREVERVAGGAAAHPSGLVRRGAPAADGAEARPCVPGGKSDRRRGQPGVVGVQSVADSAQSGQRIALQETEQLSMGTICALGIRRALGRIGDDDGQPGVTGGITGAGAAFAAEVDGCQAGERRRRARGLRGSRDSDAQVGGGQRSEAGAGCCRVVLLPHVAV